MRVAVISPIPQLERFATQGDRYHLVLSHLISSSPEYRDFYRQRVQAQDFVILDNSAHEFGAGRHLEELIGCARDLSPDEIVLPDRLFFGEDTLESSGAALGRLRRAFDRTFRYMGVPQGRTFQEWRQCLGGLIKIGVNTIGISKDYEVWDGGLQRLVEEVRAHSWEVDIHLLGWGRQLWDLKSLTSLSDLALIRGIDSAKPLVYASAMIELPNPEILNPLTVPPYPKRSNFFQLQEADIDEFLAAINIAVFKTLAGSSSEQVRWVPSSRETPGSWVWTQRWLDGHRGGPGTDRGSEGEALRGSVGTAP